MTTFDKAIEEACKESSLIKALTWICIWESERIVKQARKNPTWDTCFNLCITKVMEKYPLDFQI